MSHVGFSKISSSNPVPFTSVLDLIGLPLQSSSWMSDNFRTLSLTLFRETVLSLHHHHTVLSFGSKVWWEKQVFLMKTKPKLPNGNAHQIIPQMTSDWFLQQLVHVTPTTAATSHSNKKWLTQKLQTRKAYFLNIPTIMTWYYTLWNFIYTYIHGSAQRESNLITVQQYATVFSLLHFRRQLYMFWVLTPIIRSSCNCNYSFCVLINCNE
jgi:hypothetical protein